MELRQLEYFVAVAETANFTRAAERVHISQSGVSAQVRQLERELGLELLDRSGKSVRVTDAGSAVLPHARAALAAAAAVRDAVGDLTGLVRGHVSVGMVTACGFRGLFDQLAEFHQRNPGIDITLTEDNSDVLVEAVLDGRLDMALVGLGGDTPDGLVCRTIADELLVAAVAPDDALADRATIRLEQLRDRALVCLPRGTGVRSAFDRACASLGIEPRVALEASAPDVVAGLAIRELGVAILTESMAAAHETELRSINVTDPSIRSRLALAWGTGRATSPAATALVAHAEQRFGAEPARGARVRAGSVAARG